MCSKGVPIVLDHLIFAGDTAKDRGAQGLKVKLLKRLDRMAINAASLVVLDTKEHQEMLNPEMPVWWFRSVPRMNGMRPAGKPANVRRISCSMGYIRHCRVYRLLWRLPRFSSDRGITPKFTLIGKGQDYKKVRSISKGMNNITFREWVEPEDSSIVIASHAISLGIFSTTPKGLHVVPNKVYQSMAAGCAVITSGTAPQRRVLENGVVFVRPGDPQSAR